MSEPSSSGVISRLVSVGAYLPKKIVSNTDLSRRMDTSDEWIRTRTGITQRHIASKRETALFMGVKAAGEALERAGLSAADVDGVIVGTVTPDRVFPALAVQIQAALGIRQGFGFDVSAACSGFIYALSVADAFIRSGQGKVFLVLGVEVFSRLLDWEDRSTAVLFGDGAGAVVLQASADKSRGILSTHLHSDGTAGEILFVDGAVGSGDRRPVLKMEGREVFRHAVNHLADVVDETLAHHGITGEAIDWLVPHQANQRIISGIARRLSLPPERVISTIDRHANTSAASIPLALYEGLMDGRIKPGNLILMEALGGGLTWGSALIRL